MFKKFFQTDKTSKKVVKDAFLVAFEQNLLQLDDQPYDKQALEELSQRGRMSAQEFMSLKQDSFMCMRHMITESVSAMSRFGMLVLTGDDDPMELTQVPGISGEIKPHLSDIFHKHDFMPWQELKSEPNLDDKLIFTKTLFNYHAAWATAQAWNYVRIVNYKDFTEPDWLEPFIAAMHGWEEYQVRELMGMELTLEKEHEAGSLASDYYGLFYDIVKSGDRDPVKTWQNEAPELPE